MSNFFSKYSKAIKSVENQALSSYNLEDISAYSLDLQAKLFLENYFQVQIENKESLEKYIHLWQYEAITNIATYANKNTLFYKNLKLTSSLNSEENIIDKNATKESIITETKKFIELFPFTQAADIAKDSLSFLAISQDNVEGIVSVETSGTSTNSKHKKRIYCSENDFESTIQFFFFGMQYLLRNKEDKVAMIMSGERIGSIGHLFSIAMQRLEIPCKVINFSIDYAKIAEDLLSFGATCIVAIPWHMLNISNHIKINKLNHCIRNILLSSDTASKGLKDELANNLSCRVYDHYGVTEFGYGGAVECMKQEFLHLRALDLYIEIIDENQNSVQDGDFGEIVVTTLTREAMPLIRYRMGDRGRIVNKKCPCGSLMPCLEVQGRISQGIAIDKENFIHYSMFQDFFYQNYKDKIVDFDICIFTDEQSLNKVLLIGVDFSNQKENTMLIQEITRDFAKSFSISPYLQSEAQKNEQNIEINEFYICSMQNYTEIFKQNLLKPYTLEKKDNACSSYNSFDSLLEKKQIEEKTNIITAKKCIRTLSGTLFNYD